MHTTNHHRLMRKLSWIVIPITAGSLIFATGSPAATKKTTRKTTKTTAVATTAPAATVAPTTAAPTGAGGDIDKLVAAAKKEGTLTIYSANTEDKNKAVADEFTKQYGIKVERVPRQSGNVLIDRYLAERKAGGSPADVLVNTTYLLFRDMSKNGTLAKIDANSVPALKTYPKAYYSDAFIIAGVAQFTVCYNTDKFKVGDLQRWPDALTPKNGAKVVIANPSIDTYWPSWDAIRKDQGIDFLKKVGDSKPIFPPTSPAGMQLLTSGEAGIFFPCPTSVAGPLKAAGAPIDWKDLYPVSGLEWHVGVTESAPHPNAARLFLNWLATIDGQTPFNNNFAGASPLRPDGDKSLGLGGMPDAKGFVDPDPSVVVNSKEFIDALGFKG